MKFVITDATSTTGSNFIGENNECTTLEHAKRFSSEKEAQTTASAIDNGDGWAEVLPSSCFE